MDLISPFTGQSINQERVLKELRKWTLDQSIIGAMLREGLSTQQQLVNLAVRVQATLEPNDPHWKKFSDPLTPIDTAIVALRFLNSRPVRQQIARLVSKTHRIEKKKAMQDLKLMQEFLESNYGVAEAEQAMTQGLVVPG